MRKTGIGLFANRTFKSENVHAEYLKEGDDKPGIMPVAVQHACVTAAFASINVMNNTGISRNEAFGYTIQKCGNNNHDSNHVLGKAVSCGEWGLSPFPFVSYSFIIIARLMNLYNY
jgi:hypothetical protein